MWSPLVAIRAGIADRSHYVFQGGQTGLGRLAGKRVAPSFLAGMVPCVRIGLVCAVAVISTFRDGVVLDQSSKSPAFRRAVGGPRCRGFLLGAASHGSSRINGVDPVIPPRQPRPLAADLCPLFRGGNSGDPPRFEVERNGASKRTAGRNSHQFSSFNFLTKQKGRNGP